MQLSFQQIREDETVRIYIREADKALTALGYTEHGLAHVMMAAERAAQILRDTGHSERDQELAAIAAYLHDIGNIVNRKDHEQSGAVMAFSLLHDMGGDPAEIAAIVAAIGNHDEGTAFPVSDIAAALILADKTEVRRSRVRDRNTISFDIHDRVNYAVEDARLTVSQQKPEIIFELTIDTDICPISEYFEIFLDRMLLCRRAAEHLKRSFRLVINGQTIM